MSYIQNNLQAGEEIKYKADIHWYIFVLPAVLLLLGAFLSSAQTSFIYYIGLLLLLLGLFQLIKRVLLKMGAEYVITNKNFCIYKVMHKTMNIGIRKFDPRTFYSYFFRILPIFFCSIS